MEWFNRLSYLVATEVCMHIKKKHRAKLIEYFIDVARECFNIGNFNSLMAIMCKFYVIMLIYDDISFAWMSNVRCYFGKAILLFETLSAVRRSV